MSTATYSADVGISDATRSRVISAVVSSLAIWIGVFLSGFVIAEPAPYELFMAGTIAIWALFGLVIPKPLLPMIVLLVLFNIGGVISMMVMPNWADALLYVGVSFFLALTSIFFAAVIARKPDRLSVMFNAYLFAALITGTLGILGYLGVIPGAELFTRFDRAKGAFQDPNVFAPFLCLPAIFALHGILTKPAGKIIPQLVCFLILALAIFLSFSRAGWGLLILSSGLLFVGLFMANTSGKFRVRLMVLSLVAITSALIAILVALQIDFVRELFISRAQLVQDYDGARLGRFARHWIGFMMATEHPFGIGILEFGKIYGEDPHNVYLKSLTDYSWLGFAAYVMLIAITLAAGFKILFRNRPWQPFLLCAYIVFVGHVVIGYVIDTDHWRHFFLLVGIIWGCVAAEQAHQKIGRTQH